MRESAPQVTIRVVASPPLHVGLARRHPVAISDSESVMDQTGSFCQTEKEIKVTDITNNSFDKLTFLVENAPAELRTSERGSRFGQHAAEQVGEGVGD